LKIKNFILQSFLNKIYILLLLLLLCYNFERELILIKSFNITNENEKVEPKKIKTVNKLNEIFTNLLLDIRQNINITSKYNENNNFQDHHNKIMLCSIGKEENLYAKEFVEYYLALGFDKIIILDNNDLNGERFDNVLKPFIGSKKVEIKDLRGLKQIQIPSFNYCYMKYKYLYDWIAFFDFDEFLYIKNNINIKKYLYSNKFNKCQQILFNWYIYNDNNLLRYDNRTMIKRFTNLKFYPWRTKFIIRGNLKNIIILATSFATNINYCNSKGELIFPKSFNIPTKENNSFAYLKHFYTKTAEEYCHKRKRGYAQTLPKQNQKLSETEINAFFRYNERTPEKIKILEKCNNIDGFYHMKKYKLLKMNILFVILSFL